MIRAGDLKDKLTYQTPVMVKGNLGSKKVESYTDVFEFWGEISSPSGRESANALQRQVQVSTVVRCRNLPTKPVPLSRLREAASGRVFNVQWVDDVKNRHRELSVYCVEVTG